MRFFLAGAIALAVAACGKAPDGGDAEPYIEGNAAAGVAFNYAYAFELPSRAIAGLQEGHADHCERLGVARCRITGLGYDVDRDGDVSASLSVKLAAPIARRFGRTATVTAERASATLVGARIGGEEVATAANASETDRRQRESDASRIAKELDRPNLPSAERAELLRQQSSFVEAGRTASRDSAEQRERLANTPMTFTYSTGRGTGFANRLRDTMDTALASAAATLIAFAWLIATLGPAALLLLLLFLIWRRWGREAWIRLAGNGNAE